MNAPANWHESNADYLSAALSWLRLRLQRLASSADGQPGNDPAQAVQEAEERFAAPPAGTRAPPALVTLAERLGLSQFEQDVLLLCSAMELDTQIAALCAAAQPAADRPFPTFALALTLFDDAVWDVLSPERPLRYWRLIQIGGDKGEPLVIRALHVEERIVSYIKGLNYVDERLNAWLFPITTRATAALQPSQQACVEQAVEIWTQASREAALPVIQLLGADSPGKMALANHVAAHFGCQLHRVAADSLNEHAADLDSLTRLLQRECMLSPVALYFDWLDQDAAVEARAQAALRYFLARSDGLFFVDTREWLPRLGQLSVGIDVARPTPVEQRALWRAALNGRGGAAHGALAAQFNLEAADIHRVAAQVLAHDAPADEAQLAQRLWDSCRASVRPALNRLAQRLDAHATWDDLVLPPEQRSLLQQISAQVQGRAQVYGDWGFARKMNRGLGISALFSGDSGTGKTMAAEVIANDLRLNLYRIDLSAVVSKYIGETEANLRRLFDAAEDGGAILFFDECDALFGKRSEVKDSHDRYANIEVNYLLQRIEAYRGLAILATNMRSALDAAFVRRLRFIVTFPFPGHAQRELIWRNAFPAEMPCVALDYERLARFNLSGGNIHSAALGAAFLAAHAGKPVGMEEVMAAVRSELIKLGKPVNEADFRTSHPVGGRA